MKTTNETTRLKVGKTIFSFLVITSVIFIGLYFTITTDWRIDTADYKIIVLTKGYVNNITVTDWIHYYNASEAYLEQPKGVNIETRAYATSNNSRIQVVFENFSDEIAIVVLSGMEPLSNIPVSSIPINGASTKFSSGYPHIKGELENCTNFLFYLSISANTRIGKINVNSYYVEAVVKDGKLDSFKHSQSKERALTVSVWTAIFLSATISAICITLFSALRLEKGFQRFPVVTLTFVSVMCIIYLYLGTGGDLLSRTNVDFNYRVLLSLLSSFFHFDYDHLMYNLLLGFLIGGSLIEIWLFKYDALKRYIWYFFPLALTTSISVKQLVTSNSFYLSTGASLWIIGFAIVLLLYIITDKSRVLRRASVWDCIALLLSGYLFFSTTWNVTAGFLIEYYSDAKKSSFIVHVVVFCLPYLIVALALWILFERYKVLSKRKMRRNENRVAHECLSLFHLFKC